MRKLFGGILALVVVACVYACRQSDVPPITPQPGEPCGNAGVPCFNGDPPVFTHECCWQGSVCGGSFPNVGCPSDACCAEGDGGGSFGASKTLRVVGKKWRAQS